MDDPFGKMISQMVGLSMGIIGFSACVKIIADPGSTWMFWGLGLALLPLNAVTIAWGLPQTIKEAKKFLDEA